MCEKSEYLTLIDGNPVKQPVAYCTFAAHRGYLTPGLIRTHRCLERNCPRLLKLDCQYWEDRRQRKKNSKKRKQQLLERKYV